MSQTTAFALFLLLISPAIGSFLTVLIDRLPRGQNVVLPPSTCRSCDHRLGPRDLIPVLSFALNAGRCRHCGTAIPPWHLYVEISAIGAAVFALIAGGSMAQMALSVCFLWLLLALAVCDLIWMRLPDLLTGALFVTALATEFSRPAPDLFLALMGAVLGSGSFMVLRLGYRVVRGRDGLGFGDVKLMAGLGAALGPFALPHMLLLAALAALVAAALSRGGLVAGRALPFGTALCGAAALVWVLKQTIL